MKTQKKPPLKFKPAPKKPSPPPKPAAAGLGASATAAFQAEPKPFDSHRFDIRIGLLEQRIGRRLNSLEHRVDLIADDVKQIYYRLHLDPRLRWRATV